MLTVILAESAHMQPQDNSLSQKEKYLILEEI